MYRALQVSALGRHELDPETAVYMIEVYTDYQQHPDKKGVFIHPERPNEFKSHCFTDGYTMSRVIEFILNYKGKQAAKRGRNEVRTQLKQILQHENI